MSQADELLDGLEVPVGYTTVRAESHIVIGPDRVVDVPEDLKRIAVQYDHDVETVTFDCPRYWDGLDMSKMDVYINYQRYDKAYGCYKALDVTVDDDDDEIMHFTWTISPNVTLVAGSIRFLVCIRKTDSEGNQINHWNSELCSAMYVSEGMETEATVVSQSVDVLRQIEDDVAAITQELLTARDSGEFDGATFTPRVTTAGVLSWSNNKGLSNPPSVNLSNLALQDAGLMHNENLAVNWWLVDPINQRGQTSYTAAGYCIDRWTSKGNETNFTVDGGIKTTHVKGSFSRMTQYIDNVEHLAGRTVTFSVIASGTTTLGMYIFANKSNTSSGSKIQAVTEKAELYSFTCNVPADATIAEIAVGVPTDSVSGDLIVHAVKLELGSNQTLAHQDTNGNWVLNDPPPDKGLELLKCIQSTADSADTYANKVVYHTGNKPSAADVGARPNTWTPTAADVGARPNTWIPTAADVGAATIKTYTATVTDSWTASDTYYYQDIAVTGILDTDEPIVDIDPGTDNIKNVAYSEALCKVFRITTSKDSIRVWSTSKINTAFPIRLKVVR